MTARHKTTSADEFEAVMDARGLGLLIFQYFQQACRCLQTRRVAELTHAAQLVLAGGAVEVAVTESVPVDAVPAGAVRLVARIRAVHRAVAPHGGRDAARAVVARPVACRAARLILCDKF